MTTSPAARVVRREAAASAITHHGPTADRYQSALERYLRAMLVEQLDESEHATKPAHGFPARVVGDVMTTAVVTAYPAAQVKEIARALHGNHISAVPVVDDERHVVGVVSTSDLLARVARGSRPVPRGHRHGHRADERRKHDALTAQELMTAPAITTTPTTRIADAALAAARARVRSLPVVDAKGALIGIVSRDDFIKQFLRDDADIRRDVLRNVVKARDAAQTAGVTVTVDEGVVTLAGEVPTALLARRLVLDTSLVVGVLAVEDELTYAVDDSSLLSSGGPIFGS